MAGILDPQMQGLLQAAFAGLSASGPSRMPVSLGGVIGQAGQAGLGAYDNAAKLQSALALQEEETKLKKAALEKANLDMALTKELMGGGGENGILSGAMNDPDRLEALGQRLALAGHPGGAGLIATAQKIREKRAQEAQVATMKGAALPTSTADVVGVAPSDEAALQRVKDAAAQGRTASVAVDKGGEGIFGSLLNSPIPAIAAQARSSQGILNNQPASAVTPQHWLDLQKSLAAQEASQIERQNNLPKSTVVVQDRNSPTGWSHLDTRKNERIPGAPPPASAAAQSVNDVVPKEHADVHGQDYLDTLPTGMAANVKAIAEGKVDLSKAGSLRYGNREALLQRVMQYDPSYNQQRPKVWQDFTTGKTANNITAMNTVIAHIGTLDELTDALKNKNVQTVNALVNRVRTEVGKPEINNAEIAVQAVGNELMRVFRQVNASQHEVEAWEKKFNAAKGSPEQLKGAIKVGVDLLEGRLDAVNDQWKRNMNTEEGFPDILSPKSKTVLERVKGKASAAAADGAAPSAYTDADKEQRYQNWKKSQGK